MSWLSIPSTYRGAVKGDGNGSIRCGSHTVVLVINVSVVHGKSRRQIQTERRSFILQIQVSLVYVVH